MGYAGWSWLTGEDWLTTASVQHRAFLDSVKNWDFTELEVEFSHRAGIRVVVDYSPDYYAHDTKMLSAEVHLTRNIGTHTYWHAMGGALEMSEHRFPDYQYAKVGAGLSRGSVSFDLSYGWNSADGDSRFGRELIESPGLVLQVGYRIR